MKKLFIKFMALLNWIEGIVHLIISGIGLWGCIMLKVFDVRIMAPIIENLIFGVFSVLTGIVLINAAKKKVKKIISNYEAPTFGNCYKFKKWEEKDGILYSGKNFYHKIG